MRIIIIALIFIGGVIAAYIITKPSDEKPLKIYNPIDIQPEMVDRDLLRVGVGHKIGQFEFLDQTGNTFQSSQLNGKVYVAEYFFTTCGTICPIMNAQMQRVQEAMKNERNFAILSFTVDPEVDTVEQLNRYATAHNANPTQWHFLTGEKKNLYRLARRSFFVLKPAEVKNQGDVGSDFIHTNHFVLVDQQARIRGYYDGTNPKEVNALIHDAKRLLIEKRN
jgi:protein SCO1/2